MVKEKGTVISRFISRNKLISVLMAFLGGIITALSVAPNALSIWDRFKGSPITIELVSTPGYLQLWRNLKVPICSLPKEAINFLDIGTTERIDKKCNAVFAEVAIRVHNPTNNRTTINSCNLEISFSGTSYRLKSNGSVPISEFNPPFVSLGSFNRIILEAGSVADSELMFFFLVSPEVRKYLNTTIFRGVYLNCVDISGDKYTTEFVLPDICEMDMPQAKFCKLLKDNNLT